MVFKSSDFMIMVSPALLLPWMMSSSGPGHGAPDPTRTTAGEACGVNRAEWRAWEGGKAFVSRLLAFRRLTVCSIT